MSDTVTTMSEHPLVDYAHLPGEEHNPIMESSLHAQWVVALIGAATTTLDGTGHLVTGNVPFDPGDGGPYLAPDLMVVPGAEGEQFSLYRVGPDRPMPSVCIEVLSPSNTRRQLDRRAIRLIAAGVGELYELDPWADTLDRVDVVEGDVVRIDAVGMSSPGLALAFARVDGQLSLCCPAGRLVRAGDNPLKWLADEMRRADAAVSRADAAEDRADTAESRADRAQADADRAQADADRAQADADRASYRAALAEAELETLRQRLNGG